IALGCQNDRGLIILRTVVPGAVHNPEYDISAYHLFSDEERFSMLKELTSVYGNVSVHICKTLISDYCRKVGAKVLLRGIRNTNDFSYEFDLSLINRSLNQQVETLFVPTEQRYFLIRSSSIKELARYGGDISAMVPPAVEKAIREKYSGKNQ
ncbi:MAG: pantetheine-phosphate adenylyltransferase, partial [Treponema sp.]|nr:pantetheine-phosphate adenylyltransferase [Treponema sp.]